MSKNRDIRSFFTAVPKKADSQPALNSKKRPIVLSSDEEDTPKKKKISSSETSAKKSNQQPEKNDKHSKIKEKQRTPSKQKNQKSVHRNYKSPIAISSDEEEDIKVKSNKQNVKRQIVILSDSDEEGSTNNKKIQKIQKMPAKQEKLVPKDAIDFFGKQKVKQTPTERKSTSQSTKGTNSNTSKSEDKFEATLKQLDESKSKNDKDFEDTLLDLDDDFDADVLDETINKAIAKETNSKKPTPKKTPKAPKTPKNIDLDQSVNDFGMDPDQAKHERRRQGFAMYQQYLNRSGPVNHGIKELPEGKTDCLKNLCFLKTGVLDSMERDEFDALVKKHGGRTVQAVSRKVNYLVVGVEAGPAKLSKAIEYGIKSLSEDELLDMILIRSGLAPKYVKMANGGDSDSNANIDETVVSKSDDEQKPGRSPRTKEKQSTHKKDSERSKDKSKSPKRGKSDTDVYVEWEPKTKKSKQDEIPEFTQILPKNGSSKSIDASKAGSSIAKSTPIPTIHIESAKVVEENISLADKHKPIVSSKVIGQHKNVELLTNWLKNWAKNHLGKNKPKLQRPSQFCKNHDGAYFKCALLSGPPGVGKTTTAHLVAKELGFDVVEYNASDTRSKKMLQLEILRQLQSKSIASFAKDGTAPTSRHVLVMDEVDGMSGNEDRGGIQELIGLIKKTDIPIICMCNDREHRKMRSLINHVFELGFAKPSTQQIKGAAMTICFREGIKIDGNTLEQMITTAGNDVRQVLNHLSMWAATHKNRNADVSDDNDTEYKLNQKDITFGPWQVTRKQLDYNSYQTMSLSERSRLFYHDYSLGPLFMQENYLNVNPYEYTKLKSKKEQTKRHARRIAEASSAISMSDIIERKIRSTNNWSLLDAQGLFATVIPSHHVHGTINFIKFPAWLGKNSRATKLQRMLSELKDHSRLSLPGGKAALNLDYLKPLRNAIVTSLIKEDIDGALEVMHTNNLLRADFDNILELTDWKQVHNDFSNVESKTKAAFTRNYNKSTHMLPYSVEIVAKKKKRTVVNDVDYGDESESDDDQNETVVDDIANSAMIKKKTQKVTEKGKKNSNSKTPSKPKASNKKK